MCLIVGLLRCGSQIEDAVVHRHVGFDLREAANPNSRVYIRHVTLQVNRFAVIVWRLRKSGSGDKATAHYAGSVTSSLC